MLPKINIAERLSATRKKRISSETLLAEVEKLLSETDAQRERIKNDLVTENNGTVNAFKFDALDTAKIFHRDDIKKLCVTYRLRFVDAHYFKGDFPEEAISAIRRLEEKHQRSLRNLKLVAPAKLLKLENADDPLLLAPMRNDYFYLVHKWGNDLHPLRKIMMWPFRCLENLALSIFVISLILTFLAPLQWFAENPGIRERIITFLFVFNWIGATVVLLGVGKGKNVSEEIWHSKYYNA